MTSEYFSPRGGVSKTIGGFLVEVESFRIEETTAKKYWAKYLWKSQELLIRSGV